MRWAVRIGTAVAIVVASVIPTGVAYASVSTPGVTVGSTESSTSSPPCHFSLDTWPATKGSAVTALHVTGAWSCHGVDLNAYGQIDLEDVTNSSSSSAGGWSVGSASGGTAGPSGALHVDYMHAKAGHLYQATFVLTAPLDPSWQSDGPCSANGGSAQVYACVLQEEYIVQQGPMIGPVPAPAPVHRSLTVTTTDGKSCEVDLDLAPAGPGELAYTGSVPPATCTFPLEFGFDYPVEWAQTFAYADRYEAGPTEATGNSQCQFRCASTTTSAGVLPAVGSYTVTYYAVLNSGGPVASLPPDCTVADFNRVYCELSASVT